MKTKKLLLFIPVIALSSCSSIGKEITPEEANEIAYPIFLNQQTISEYNFSYSVTNNMGDSKETRSYKAIFDENGDYMISREEKETSKGGTYQSSKTIYYFKPSKSSTVLYVKQFNGSTNKTTIESYFYQAGDGYEEFEIALNKQKSFKEEATGYYSSTALALGTDPGVGANYDSTYTYYSNGDKNLTAKLSFVYNKTDSGSDTIKTINRTYSFNNELFVKYEGSYVSFDGKKRTETAKCDYKNLKISFPSDWREHIKSGLEY